MKLLPLRFDIGDPMQGAFISMLFFMGAHFAFLSYLKILVYLAFVGV